MGRIGTVTDDRLAAVASPRLVGMSLADPFEPVTGGAGPYAGIHRPSRTNP